MKTPGSHDSRDRRPSGFTLVELLCVIAILSALATLLLIGLPRLRESSRRQACMSNLKQMAMGLRMYADESRSNFYPPLMRFTSVDWTPERGEFYVAPCALSNPPRAGAQIQNTFDWHVVFPEYVTDVSVNVCPSDPNRARVTIENRWRMDIDGDGKGDAAGSIDACAVTAESYGYLPWAILSYDSDDVDALLPEIDYIRGLTEVFSRRIAEGPGVFELDLPGTVAGTKLYRYREGIERMLITDVNGPVGQTQSNLPLMFDLVSATTVRYNHVPGGGNVIFLDGHVSFVKYPGRFPMSPEFSMVAGIFGSPT